jgi:uncharacterized protein with ATP-grasp and redox domains
LIDEIPDQPIRQLEDGGSPDWEVWSAYVTPWEGKNWLEVPWFFGEHYFYRRIIEAVDYFNTDLDPFGKEKQLGLEKSGGEINSLALFLKQLNRDLGVKLLRGVFRASLWGNQADLSLWPAGSSANPDQLSQISLESYLLADDTDRILDQIENTEAEKPRLDLLLDNAGFELVTDLGLADTLIRFGFVSTVVLHVKAHPTFVSDVIEIDVPQAIDFLSSAKDNATRALGTRLEEYSKDGRLKIQSRLFWNSPLAMWELPTELRSELAKSDLIISKGDANFRRLLGDREWDFTTSFQQVVDYLPAPLAALRTLKAELALGMTLNSIQETYNQDPEWLVDGKWGVIHFSPAAIIRKS